MTLPREVLDFLGEKSRTAGALLPQPDDDLFRLGVLDSFTLVDFITVLENACAIRVPDADVNTANFQNIHAIERYLLRVRKG
jgi:acyl carrier protein